MSKKQAYTIAFGEVATDSTGSLQEGRLAVDVIPSESMIHVLAPMAGVDTGTIDIHIHNDVLTIRGERSVPAVLQKSSNQYHKECFWGPFSRTIVLPVPVIAEQANAMFDKGVLQIDIPKRATDRTIPITIVEE